MLAPPIGSDLMAKTLPEPSPTETVRVASELMEMLREICYHSRDERNRRPKITAVVDEMLRPAVVKRHREVMQRAKKEAE